MRLTSSLALVGSLQFGISGPLDCHVYALQGPAGVVLIDGGAGTHTDQMLANLSADFGTEAVETIAITHCHLDHCGGAASFRANTHCRVITPEHSSVALERADDVSTGLRAARERGIYPADYRFSPCPVDRRVRDGEEFEAAGLRFTAIHVRGHSRDSFCFLTEVDGQRWLFTGDVVFYGGVLGVINFEDSGMSGYRADLHKLKGLAVEGLFPGHGLFTLRGGQRHIDSAIEQVGKGFMPRQIGQGDLIF
ncbi:MAG TPA: MBL fold metallo-hydrolase [Terriglobia bacterium]|nr:MBL fold metallo-hydrolase [Terriglobia bacterium]